MTDVDASLDRMERTIKDLRRVVRRLRIWAAVAVTGMMLALVAVGAVGLDVRHSAGARADLRCTETMDRTEAISDAIQGAVDDVMDAIADQVATDPDATRAVDVIRQRVDRRLSVRLEQIPKC